MDSNLEKILDESVEAMTDDPGTGETGSKADQSEGEPKKAKDKVVPITGEDSKNSKAPRQPKKHSLVLPETRAKITRSTRYHPALVDMVEAWTEGQKATTLKPPSFNDIANEALRTWVELKINAKEIAPLKTEK